MRKYLLHVLIISFVVLLAPTVSFADADRIFKENSRAVVKVTAYDEKGDEVGNGSGFIVRQDGAVVTNYHVIGMAKDIKVKAGDKVFDVEGLIYTDKENDLVILKAKAKGMPVVKLGVIEKANIGERVYVIGYPLGLEKTISVGLLSGIRKIDKEETLWVCVSISRGISGGPVFNRSGEVIGVATTGGVGGTRPFCVAMPVKLIKDKISNEMVTSIKELVLEDYLNTVMFWNSLGGTHVRSGKDLAAIQVFKQATRVDPHDVFGHYNLGAAYARIGEHKEAIESYKQAIKIVPDFPEAHFSLGFHYELLGEHKEAFESYKQAIRIDPNYADAHYNIGLIYGKSSMYNDEAIESYKQAIRIDPDLGVAHFHLGLAYVNSGMDEEGIASLKQAIRIDPDLVVAHLYLGLAYAKSGMDEEGIASLKQAIRIAPDLAVAHLNLGLAYAKSGMNKEGIASFKQAIRINPNYADAHLYLGSIYAFSNNRDSALEQHKILKNFDPGRANVLFNMIPE